MLSFTCAIARRPRRNVLPPMAYIDLDRRVLRVAIGALTLPSGRGGVGHGAGRLRTALGREVHNAYRARRAARFGDAFTAEVPVSLRCQLAGFDVQLIGRADGILRSESALVVEEVKSVVLDAPALAAATPEDMPGFCLQARLYALCLSLASSERVVEARLVLVSVLDDSERELALAFDPDATWSALEERVRALVAEAEAARLRARRRAASARALRFPYPRERPPQAQLGRACDDALASAQHVLAVAPTGTGKTAAALLAGLRHALRSDATLYFTTAKNTQKQLAARTFEDIAAAAGLGPDKLRAVSLAAKDELCPPGNLQCHPERCSYLRDYERRAEESDAAAALARSSGHLSRDAVYQRGVALTLCPFELARDLAAAADLVICDYNHVFDRAAALPAIAELARRERMSAGAGDSDDPAGGDGDGAAGAHDDDAPRAAVIIDEAHNLVERARAYASPWLRRAAIELVLERIASGAYLGSADAALALPGNAANRALLSDIATFCRELASAIERHQGEPGAEERAAVDDTFPLDRVSDEDLLRWHELADRGERLLLAFAMRCRLHARVFPRDPLVELLRTLGELRVHLAARDQRLVPCAAGPAAPGGAGLGITCVDPGRLLAAQHQRSIGTIAMSATLEPLAYYRERLGFEAEDTISVRVPSPFPAAHRCVLIDPSVGTALRERDQQAEAIARAIERVVKARAGRYAAYFPSFAFLSQVRAVLDLASESVLTQLPQMPPALRVRLLNTLRQRPGPTLLLAVTGGVFAEGIDLPGDELIGAIIVGPSLPPPSFERVLMRAYFDEHADGQGFAYAMRYPAMQRVIQAAGRVLRTPEDRGVIALLGRRFAEPDYLACMPAEWYLDQSDEPVRADELISHEPASRLAAFWDQAPKQDAE